MWSSAIGTARTAASSRCSPGSTSRCPARPATGVTRSMRAHAAGAVKDVDIDAIGRPDRSLAEWCAASSTGTDEITADDAETRSVCRRAAAAGMVLLKNDAGVLPLSPPTRVALIGPYADTGRVQGGGSARVRADRPAPILPSLRARGFAVDFERGVHDPQDDPGGPWRLRAHRDRRERGDAPQHAQAHRLRLAAAPGARARPRVRSDAHRDVRARRQRRLDVRLPGDRTGDGHGRRRGDVRRRRTGDRRLVLQLRRPRAAGDRPARSRGAVPDRDRVSARAPPRLARVRVGRRATCDGRSDRRRRAVGGRGRRRARRRRDERRVGDRERGSDVDGPARSPGRAGRRGRSREPQDRGRAQLRFAGHDAVARRGRGGAADVVSRRAGRVGPRRRAVR